MSKLLPDQLKELWQCVECKNMSTEEFGKEQDRLLAEYRSTWERALLLSGHHDLQESLLCELGMYLGCADAAETRNRCCNALADVKGEWHGKVDGASRESVEQFYNDSQAMIYELMWWHTLVEDTSPLAYVSALHFAGQQGCGRHLDFGSGVGSGGIIFRNSGMNVTLADISSSMLNFSKWRFDQRKLSVHRIDLKTSALPDGAFDMVTAMDVFEHLVNPIEAVDQLWEAMEPGGFLFGRFHAEADEDRPQHIVLDFDATLAHLHNRGFVQIWQDEWLWGHKIFQKQS